MFFIIKILLLDEKYAPDLAGLDKECFNEFWTENMFFGDLKSDFTRYFGAFFDDVLIAYIGMWITADEGQICNVAVHPDYRQKGVASLLINKLLDVCSSNNLKSIILEVREGNLNAVSLYNKFGFEKVGLRKNYYKNPTENAILMTKFLRRND